jgi:hypothetical protein
MMKLVISAALVAVALIGCQSSPPQSSGSSTPDSSGSSAPDSSQIHPASGTQRSGFLSNATYTKLAPAAEQEGVLLYVDRSIDYKPYRKILFEPTAVYVVPNPDYQGLPREELMRMTTDFQRSFMAVLAPDYVMVTRPGPDVLRVRSAITGVQPTAPARGVTDFIPIKALYNVARKAAGAAPQVAEMSAELEVVAPNGAIVAAATATRKGEQRLPQGEQITWHDMQSISDYWARNFKQRLDDLRGVKVSAVQ